MHCIETHWWALVLRILYSQGHGVLDTIEAKAWLNMKAAIAQLGERQTEDLKVSGSIPDRGIFFLRFLCILLLRTTIPSGRTIQSHASFRASISMESHSLVDFMAHRH